MAPSVVAGTVDEASGESACTGSMLASESRALLVLVSVPPVGPVSVRFASLAAGSGSVVIPLWCVLRRFSLGSLATSM